MKLVQDAPLYLERKGVSRANERAGMEGLETIERLRIICDILPKYANELLMFFPSLMLVVSFHL